MPLDLNDIKLVDTRGNAYGADDLMASGPGVPAAIIPQVLADDGTLLVLYGTTADALVVRPTERNRTLLIIENTLVDPIKVAPAGTADDSLTVPSTGYVTVNPGEQFRTHNYIAYWCYVPITGVHVAQEAAGHVRVYLEQSA